MTNRIKKQLLSIAMIFSFCGSFAQLGSSFDEVLEMTKNDASLHSSKIAFNNEEFFIISESTTTGVDAKYFHFSKDSICVLVLTYIDAKYVNDYIKQFDKDFVKLGELSWKDYSQNMTIKIILHLDKNLFCLAESI